MLRLKTSPRLYISRDALGDLNRKLHGPLLKSLAKRVINDAEWLVDAPPIRERGTLGNLDLLGRIRLMTSRFQCLTAAWVLKRDMRHREAAIRHLGSLMDWTHISCEANEDTPADEEMPFCLSYGQQAADIGMMYDVFHPEMTDEERKVFFDVVNRFHMKQALRCLKNPPWWAFKSWSNWNGVCSGGIGMMALAMYDDMPECRKLIPFVEKSLGAYFESFVSNGGGCHEGTGYWNYGMHYAVRYLLSWESATGRKHPAFKIKELREALNFPLDFTGITFGDNDGWGPGGFFFELAGRLKMPNVALNAGAYLPKSIPLAGGNGERHAMSGDLLFSADKVPSASQMKELRTRHASDRTPVARVYKGLGWGALADDDAYPRLRLSARGGSSKITGHGHIDLLSMKCMIDGEVMITDQVSGGTGATFGARGHEQYDRSPASKSTLFVDGLGCRTDAECDATEVVKGRDILGIRIDGSHVYLPRWREPFIGRLILMVESSYWLVIDRVLFPLVSDRHWMESRFHTYADCRSGQDWVSMKSGKERMTMTFASLQGGVLQRGVGMPSAPGDQTTVYRWMSAKGHNDGLHVSALNPGSKKLIVRISRDTTSGFVLEVEGPNRYSRSIRISNRLKLRR